MLGQALRHACGRAQTGEHGMTYETAKAFIQANAAWIAFAALVLAILK